MCINTNCELWARFESTQTTLSELPVGITIEYRANFQAQIQEKYDYESETENWLVSFKNFPQVKP